METTPRNIELLAPARDAETAIQAIVHGADAVYMGPSGFGARKSASNSLDEIKRVIDFAHPYRARVYATVNTIFFDREAKQVERLISDLYRIGTDAIIVQDMGILRLDIPPIELHASTQCDTRSVEKAQFLESVGFGQIVLARELTLGEVREICHAVNVPVEVFVHGALCVSYSGRCHISQQCLGRSANRGECAQFCRMPYTLTDADGNVLAKDKYLLSLRDFNASNRIPELLEAGVSSFKIEGRLKDTGYVKNVTASYRRIIDGIIGSNPEKYVRSSVGVEKFAFEPNLAKSFNRGFTHYFLDGKRPQQIASLNTPKSLGEIVTDHSELHNGDGVSYFDPKTGEYKGVRINRVSNGRVFPAAGGKIPHGVELHRTADHQFAQLLQGKTATRVIPVQVDLYEHRAEIRDARGLFAAVSYENPGIQAEKPCNFEAPFAKLGNTIYTLERFEAHLPEGSFLPPALLTRIRRELIEALDVTAASTYPFHYRGGENREARIADFSGWRENVANRHAEEFYRDHGVAETLPALETGRLPRHEENRVLMTCRHCILRELGKCLKEGNKVKTPLQIATGNNKFGLKFNCDACEMQVLYKK